MSQRRVTGQPCPIDERLLGMDICQPCRFYRGASRKNGNPWEITCNWPRNGSEIERAELPEVFRRAFET